MIRFLSFFLFPFYFCSHFHALHEVVNRVALYFCSTFRLALNFGWYTNLFKTFSRINFERINKELKSYCGYHRFWSAKSGSLKRQTIIQTMGNKQMKLFRLFWELLGEWLSGANSSKHWIGLINIVWTMVGLKSICMKRVTFLITFFFQNIWSKLLNRIGSVSPCADIIAASGQWQDNNTFWACACTIQYAKAKTDDDSLNNDLKFAFHHRIPLV